MSIDFDLVRLQQRYPALPIREVAEAALELSRHGPEGDSVFNESQVLERFLPPLWPRVTAALGLLSSGSQAPFELNWRLLEPDGRLVPVSAQDVARALAYDTLLHPVTGELIIEGLERRIVSFYRVRVRAVESTDRSELN